MKITKKFSMVMLGLASVSLASIFFIEAFKKENK